MICIYKIYWIKFAWLINKLIIFITAKMINKNSRNSIDERNKARSQKANINIQINFNMKDKPQGFSGKKIDNYVEI